MKIFKENNDINDIRKKKLKEMKTKKRIENIMIGI